MKLSGVLSALALTSAVSATTVSYDTGYDDKSRPMTAVSCSDGKNGLITKYGRKTQGNIPTKYVGGVNIIEGWNSANCGGCYRLEYKGKKINVLAIDHAASGFNIGLDAMNALTNGQAVKLGRINAQVYHANPSDCGLKK
ncbi:Cerato-platanin [Fusarium oxysporum II5]|uniref:Protein SnodProt1 n=3 Tax=Fusarium oxysporum species complex TaxID=171631 RepID=N1RCL8_FUSC4|nr:uncharacterized protein FOIG_07409 [Fusarium odoratissimum NRRL 54006]XP_031064096.1 uncharacterized protein FOIG_07409 [Fusarium odoratissimum NRRL 54006]EMT63329.1 Protein SnodProt1 [Fusarium odoratissimum]KAK2129497.1 Cerato-platanin [Fusarium oxysporum II5]TXC02019.1 hypothetical protein FocTR4_00008344 [Fusarium oxysporum f. sp. cubense]EXM02006.1 hypothetical protein FOIG_07409 [Fusarium odoratissimum NRRL 54006]EXM02007.1 hypothetical protein FOIG_07409 [Fusarium odoratissimum NRRL 